MHVNIYSRIPNVHVDVCLYGHFPGRVFEPRTMWLYMYIRLTSTNDPCLHIYIKYNTYIYRERQGEGEESTMHLPVNAADIYLSRMIVRL